jgi:hypothetical protein
MPTPLEDFLKKLGEIEGEIQKWISEEKMPSKEDAKERSTDIRNLREKWFKTLPEA